MQRSSVVLPEPEWPNSAVTPRPGKTRSTSSVKPVQSTRNLALMSFISIGLFWIRPPGVKRQQHQEGEDQHHGGKVVRLGIFQRLHMVVYLHRGHPGHAQQVAAYHQRDAEFAHGVRERQDAG